MPFTFSHPAIVLPLTYLPRKWFSLTGLVVGSVVPDFEYFIRMKSFSHYSHTIKGIFWFDLPLGILLAFIFHNIVRNSLFSNLPLSLKSRFSVFKSYNWNEDFKRNWVVIIISIVIGAASHLFWDSFTHGNHFFVNSIPSLETKIAIADKNIQLFRILQHVSSIFGAIIIAFSLWQMRPDRDVKSQVSFKYWSIFLLITLMFIAMVEFSRFNLKINKELIIISISAILISLILTPLLSGKLYTQEQNEV